MECFEMVAEFQLNTAEEFGFKVRKSHLHETVVGYDVTNKQLFVDRSRSGEINFHADFTGRHSARLETAEQRVKLHILVDSSSIEVFAGEGETAITDLIFPEQEEQGVEIYLINGQVQLLSLVIAPLKTIWK